MIIFNMTKIVPVSAIAELKGFRVYVACRLTGLVASLVFDE